MRSAEADLFVEKTKAAAKIIDVIQKYTTLEKRGSNFWGRCPFHESKVSTLSVADEKGFFYCFKCHKGGNVFKFVSLAENISYFDAVKKLAKEYGVG